MAGKIVVRSAINPLLLLCVVISFPALLAAMFTSGLPQIVFFVFAAVPPLAVLKAFFSILKTSPSLLRSEEYQIRQQALELIGDKDNRFHATAKHIQAVSNPALPAPNPQEEDFE
jgi:hypothetical protein